MCNIKNNKLENYFDGLSYLAEILIFFKDTVELY